MHPCKKRKEKHSQKKKCNEIVIYMCRVWFQYFSNSNNVGSYCSVWSLVFQLVWNYPWGQKWSNFKLPNLFVILWFSDFQLNFQLFLTKASAEVPGSCRTRHLFDCMYVIWIKYLTKHWMDFEPTGNVVVVYSFKKGCESRRGFPLFMEKWEDFPCLHL